MAQSLLISCGLNEHNSFVHISEESDIDGTFIISSILGQKIRQQNGGVLLICLQHSFQHYVNAGLRLGYNLEMFNGKSLHILDLVEEISKNYLEIPSNVLEKNGNLSEKYLIDKIKLKLNENFKEKNSTTIVVDNLSVLLNLGLERNTLIRFCNDLHLILEENRKFNLITKLSNCDLFEIVDENLKELSTLQLRLIKLKSGNFKEVDGRLKITKSNLKGLYGIEHYEKNILYKVNDKSIKIFNPGEIGIKI